MKKNKGPQKGTKYIGTNMHHFGKILAAARRKRGLTQIELSKISRVSKRSITYYERETKNPSLKVMTKLATALNIPVERFLPKKNDKYGLAIDRGLSRRFELAQKLPTVARNDIKRYIDNVAKAHGMIQSDSG